ncbi:ABC transporter ATP-binding protein [Paenibacillus chartarius]|uniref:ABC transporter ATP-binding protein n=1 Tax=Paenibacillus chartarius TaxID=747481 RepID=A0ABV6DP73_9BACL
MHVELQGVSKQYRTGDDREVRALDNVSLHIGEAEFVCLLGPSGCGKSTLLKLMAGIERPSAGSVRFAGKPVNGASTERGYVFQEYALFPWLTVDGNIRFGLELKGISRKRQQEAVERYLELLGLKQAARLYPKELSGGMSQRVAIARALILQPKLLLMDEPFAALDAILRRKLQEEVARLWRQENITFVLVTHDVEEAIYLADRIIVMSPGPGRIKEEVAVRLPRPRVRTEAGFVALRNRLLELLHDGEDAADLGQSEANGSLRPGEASEQHAAEAFLA